MARTRKQKKRDGRGRGEEKRIPGVMTIALPVQPKVRLAIKIINYWGWSTPARNRLILGCYTAKDGKMYTVLHLDPKPGAEWKPIKESALRNAIGCRFSPWPSYAMEDRERRIDGMIERLARTGDTFTHSSRDKYKVQKSV